MHSLQFAASVQRKHSKLLLNQKNNNMIEKDKLIKHVHDLLDENGKTGKVGLDKLADAVLKCHKFNDDFPNDKITADQVKEMSKNSSLEID